MEAILLRIEIAMGNYADGIWSENDAKEEINQALEEFFEKNN